MSSSSHTIEPPAATADVDDGVEVFSSFDGRWHPEFRVDEIDWSGATLDGGASRRCRFSSTKHQTGRQTYETVVADVDHLDDRDR